MAQNRYEVVFSKYRFGGSWTSTVVRRLGTAERAVQLATRIGDRHPDLRVTKATYHDRRSTVEVRDRKTGKKLWEHDGVIVPSVGEVGYW